MPALATTTDLRCRRADVAPFAFGGTLHEVVIELVGRPDVDATTVAARSEMSRQ